MAQEVRRCPECGGQTELRVEGRKYVEGGLPHVTLRNVEVRSCVECGHTAVRLPAIQSLHALLALAFVKKTARLAPVERKFLRKYLGFSSASFAQAIGVADETVLAWESGDKSMPIETELWLRVTVAMRKRLESYESKPQTGTTPRRPPTFEVHASA